MGRAMVGAVAVILTALAGGAQNLSPQRDQSLVSALRPLEFLIGEWVAAPGQTGETGAFNFRSDVQGHALIRTNFALYPAVKGKAASRHDDLMVIAEEGDVIRADYFDSEGHVIRYVVQVPGTNDAVFLSEVKASEPRYRLRYVVNVNGTLKGTFDIAPPGRVDEFSPYLTWSARRAP